MHQLAQRITAGDVRALARAISYIEDAHPERYTMLKDIYPYLQQAYKIGITGPPGAGKSSLVNQLIAHLRTKGLSVGVLAVDPTSPFSGGALLGDRVRMNTHFTDPEVYIRSMGTRGSLGGLARATKEAVHLLDAFGKDVILIETVGVGQSELEIMNVADTTLVVLNPGGGDSVQAFKAGIMEIADLFVVNKADVAGVGKLVAEINYMLDMTKHDAAWRPPVLETISTRNQGIDKLWETCLQHQAYRQSSGEGARRKQQRVTEELREVLQERFQHLLQAKLHDPQMSHMISRLQQGETDPYTVAEELLAAWGLTNHQDS